MRKALVIASLVLIAAAGAFASGAKDDGTMTDKNGDGMMASDDSMMESDGMSDDKASDDGMMGDSMAGEAMTADFTTLKDAEMYAQDGVAVLLFVDGSDASKSARMIVDDNLSAIGPGVTVVAVPLSDTMTAGKYMVSQPGTFVIIDSMGTEASRWVGGTLEEFLRMVKMEKEM